MGKPSRDKGKRGEREAARRLTELLGVNVTRTAQHKGGADSPDLSNLPGLHAEVKRAERLRLYAALEQAESEAGEDNYPIVLHRPNGRPWVAICYLADLPGLAATVTAIKQRTSP